MVRAHLLEAPVVGPLLADEDRVHRRLHVVVDAPPADPAEELERPVVRLEHHLLALAREQLNQQHPAVAQPHVRRLHLGRDARQDRVFVAPVELVGLARIEDQRHIGLRRWQRLAPTPPVPGVAAHRVVAALIAQRRQLFVKPHVGQPVPALLLLVRLQAPLQLSDPRTQIRPRLNRAVVAERRLVAPHRLADRVPRNLQIPDQLPDRRALAQMFPTDPCNRLHNQHLPHLVRPKTRRVQKTLNPGGQFWGIIYLTEQPIIPIY